MRSVRSQLGIVTQRPDVFGTSIRDNIALTDPSLDLDAVIRAGKLACIDEDIAAIAMGYETILIPKPLRSRVARDSVFRSRGHASLRVPPAAACS